MLEEQEKVSLNDTLPREYSLQVCLCDLRTEAGVCVCEITRFFFSTRF